MTARAWLRAKDVALWVPLHVSRLNGHALLCRRIFDQQVLRPWWRCVDNLWIRDKRVGGLTRPLCFDWLRRLLRDVQALDHAVQTRQIGALAQSSCLQATIVLTNHINVS